MRKLKVIYFIHSVRRGGSHRVNKVLLYSLGEKGGGVLTEWIKLTFSGGKVYFFNTEVNYDFCGGGAAWRGKIEHFIDFNDTCWWEIWRNFKNVLCTPTSDLPYPFTANQLNAVIPCLFTITVNILALTRRKYTSALVLAATMYRIGRSFKQLNK